MYENEKNYSEAAQVYEDIARNSSKAEFAGAAADRAKALHQMGQAASGGAAADQPPAVDTTTIPSDASAAEPAQVSAPAQKRPGSAARKKNTAASAKE